MLMAEQFLDRPNVVPGLQHVDAKGMPKAVAGGGLCDARARTAAQTARCTTVGCRWRRRRIPASVSTYSGARRAGNADYLEATCFDSFRGAFVCNTRTRWRPVAGMTTLFPSKIALAVILRP
jgi:hypothetical protein